MGSRAPGSSRDVLGDGVRSSRILIISGWGRELQARCGRELLGGEGPEMEGPGRPPPAFPLSFWFEPMLRRQGGRLSPYGPRAKQKPRAAEFADSP